MARKPEVIRKHLQAARAQERAYHTKVVALEKELAKVTGKPQASPKARTAASAAASPAKIEVFHVEEQVKNRRTGALTWEGRARFATRAQAESDAAEQTRMAKDVVPGENEQGDRTFLGKYRVRAAKIKAPPMNVARAQGLLADAKSPPPARGSIRKFFGF